MGNIGIRIPAVTAIRTQPAPRDRVSDTICLEARLLTVALAELMVTIYLFVNPLLY